MKKRPFQWIKMHSDMLINAGSYVGTTAINALFGFVYWWVAARWFSPRAVGLAAALFSITSLLGTFATLGSGTYLIGELPRQQGKELSLINTALIFAGCTGGLVGVLFALIAPSLSPAFQVLRISIYAGLLFAAGVALTVMSLVFDDAMIGLFKGGLRLCRNTLFAIIKLVALVLIALWLRRLDSLAIYATWVIGITFSLVILAPLVVLNGKAARGSYKPQWRLLRNCGSAALHHHLVNMALNATTTILPVLALTLISVVASAWFYVSYLLANFVYIVSGALTMILYAVGSARPNALKSKVRLTLIISTVVCIVTNAFVFVGGRQILSMFGRNYADQAFWCLCILGLCAFPWIIKDHYVAFHRIQRTIALAAVPIIAFDLLELSCAAFGARSGGLTGLSLGLLTAMCIEALYMSRTVYRFARFGIIGSEYVKRESSEQSCDSARLSDAQTKEEN